MTVDELARELGVHRITIVRHINSGTIKAVKYGKSWRINECEVERIKEVGF